MIEEINYIRQIKIEKQGESERDRERVILKAIYQDLKMYPFLEFSRERERKETERVK